MKKIYKYPLQITDRQTISMPEHPHILTVQTQNETPCLWALIDTENALKEYAFHMFGTGLPIEITKGLVYIGTFQILHDKLVFHVFFNFLLPKNT
jgi:hypothetical protein